MWLPCPTIQNKHQKMKRKTIIICAAVVAAVVLTGAYATLCPMLRGDTTAYIYVDQDDNADSVRAQVGAASHTLQASACSMLMKIAGHVHTGRYEISSRTNALSLFRHLRGGQQTPVELTVPSVRTMEDLAGYVGRNLMIDSLDFLRAVKSQDKMQALGVDTANAYCLFIPNTYEMYWNISLDKFLSRMKRESDAWWTPERLSKAAAIPLSPSEVYTLASIVDEETANNGEKPQIAGMYINRLHAGMPLQADPTIKFAWHQFGLKRIYHGLLNINSAYNTYRRTGLPPGPIRIASVEGIKAVLGYTHHGYMYMCAKEDFSGTHRFARTYAEHMKNAARYAAALNERGIK